MAISVGSFLFFALPKSFQSPVLQSSASLRLFLENLLSGMLFLTLGIIYFGAFWILPSHLLLEGLKKKHLKKFLPWIFFMLFHTSFLFLFSMFTKDPTPMLLMLIPQVIIWAVAGNMCR